MAWHDHPYFWKPMARARGYSTDDPEKAVDAISRNLDRVKTSQVTFVNTRAQLYGELRWTASKRPYYDIYPSVTQAFTKIDLTKIKGEHIQFPMPDLLLRFQVGREFE